MVKYKLTYFHTQGRAELCRLVLKAAKVEFEDERLTPEEWAKRKESKILNCILIMLK